MILDCQKIEVIMILGHFRSLIEFLIFEIKIPRCVWRLDPTSAAMATDF